MSNIKKQLCVQFKNEEGEGRALRVQFLSRLISYFESAITYIYDENEFEIDLRYVAGCFVGVAMEQVDLFPPFVWDLAIERPDIHFRKGLNELGIADVSAISYFIFVFYKFIMRFRNFL